MKRGLIFLLLPALAAISGCGRGKTPEGQTVAVRAGVDHSAWDQLVRQYVDARGRVSYEAWKASPEDLRTLREYLAHLGAPADPPASGDDLGASLINAYNASTIHWILENYPTPSIRSLKGAFTERRHTVGGRRVSLDDIEHATLRPLFGYRVHAALVCAARSCPPLRREAYTAARLDDQLDQAMRGWLDREDLNRFDLAAKRAQISPIFRWYAEDFEKAGGLRSVLKKHSRGDVPRMLDSKDLDIDYLRYDWGLNDRAEPPRAYGGFRALRDRLKGLFD